MSKRSPAKTRVQTPTTPKRRYVGARQFNKQAQALRSSVKRKRQRKLIKPSMPFRVGETLQRIPRAAWICAAVACINAVCWSILTPPFQVPDEPSHFAYTQQLAVNHKLPSSGKSSYSPEEQVVLRDIHQYEVRQTPEKHTLSSATEQQQLEEDLDKRPSRHGDGGVGGAYSTPPLYALLETVPYGLASGGTLLDQLELMRLASALMAGLAALFIFLFVREALPGAPWAWTVGGLSVALAPLLGFMSGAVNPDSMLVAVSAAIFYGLARAFRRGLTRSLAIAIGAMTAVGFLTKLNFIGLAPGIILGMIVLTVRESRTYGRAAYGSLGLALAIASLPVWLYILVNLLSGHPGLGVISSTLKLGSMHGSILSKISYVWQLYLPRLPGMTNYFPGLSTTRQLWFNRGVGYYGWLDTSFPVWVDNAALLVTGVLSVLCTRALIAGRAILRTRIVEIVVYGTMGVGLMVLIGVTSYLKWTSEGIFAEPRYLLPMLPLLGIGLALAARGAGRRWGPVVGTAIIILFLGHDAFSQLLMIARYYS
jgi:hypothetical protein